MIMLMILTTVGWLVNRQLKGTTLLWDQGWFQAGEFSDAHPSY